MKDTSFRCKCGRRSPVPMSKGELKNLIKSEVAEIWSVRFRPYVDSRADELESYFESEMDRLESD